MKIVQTCWSCNYKDMLRFDAGWYAAEYHLMAWTLSCLQLKKYYPEVVLHADSVTAKMLIDTLKLPYTDVICDLDKFNNLPPDLWALTKIHTYSEQSKPFLHVDGDVFIFKAFEESLLAGALIAQNLEFGTDRYINAFRQIEAQTVHTPAEIEIEKSRNNKIYTYNAGILGGHDLDFFELYTSAAKENVALNNQALSKANQLSFNIYFEQYLFYCLSAGLGKKVSVLFNEVIPDDQYIGFGNFLAVPFLNHYLHLIGPPYKKNIKVCQDMANRLRLDYPDFYYRIVSLFKWNNVGLKRDYYYFIDQPTENLLIDRYINLRSMLPNSELVACQKGTQQRSDAKSKLHILQNVINTLDNEPYLHNNGINRMQILGEASRFEQELSVLLETRFSNYSQDALYTRDINYTSYFERVFSNEVEGFQYTLVANTDFEIIESTFDWSIFDEMQVNINIAKKDLMQFPYNTYICVVPECDNKQYSLTEIDELDIQLIKIWKEPASISQVMTMIKSEFDPDDLENSLPDFELLIAGRVRKLLAEKMIRILS